MKRLIEIDDATHAVVPRVATLDMVNAAFHAMEADGTSKPDAANALGAALAAQADADAGAPVPPILTDKEIETITGKLGARWNGNVWAIEDADFYPLVRGLLYRYTDAPAAPAQSEAVALTNEQFIAEHGHRLATMMNLESYDIADRDAQIAARLSPAPVKPAESVAWAVYWGFGEMQLHGAYVRKSNAEAAAETIKSNTEIRPLYLAPIGAGDAELEQAIKRAPEAVVNPSMGWCEEYAKWRDAASALLAKRGGA